MSKPTTITIDDVQYVRADSVTQLPVDKPRHIIRTESAGVHYGMLMQQDGSQVFLKSARRLWYWKGACTLSQLAVDGVKNPDECKFSVRVPEITVLGVIEIIPCTQKAIDCIESVKEWKK